MTGFIRLLLAEATRLALTIAADLSTVRRDLETTRDQLPEAHADRLDELDPCPCVDTGRYYDADDIDSLTASEAAQLTDDRIAAFIDGGVA